MDCIIFDIYFEGDKGILSNVLKFFYFIFVEVVLYDYVKFYNLCLE